MNKVATSVSHKIASGYPDTGWGIYMVSRVSGIIKKYVTDEQLPPRYLAYALYELRNTQLHHQSQGEYGTDGGKLGSCIWALDTLTRKEGIDRNPLRIFYYLYRAVQFIKREFL